jgi:hypothetical protein
MKALTFVAILTALATFAIARGEDKKPEAKKAASSKATCKSGSEERIVEVQSREGGGCKVVYTSAGTAKTVGEAAHQLDFCDQLLERMIKKFEAAGYKCG